MLISCQTKRFLGYSLDEPNAQELRPLQAKSDIKTGTNKIIFKPRDQQAIIMVIFIDLIQIISVFCNIYLLACPPIVTTFPETSHIFQISN